MAERRITLTVLGAGDVKEGKDEWLLKQPPPVQEGSWVLHSWKPAVASWGLSIVAVFELEMKE
jgi:hypothetical protein